jgi:hypothetical protein
VFIPSFGHFMVSYLYNDNEYEYTTPFIHLPPNESIEHEFTPTPLLPRWDLSTREVIGNLFDEPIDQHCTYSHF